MYWEFPYIAFLAQPKWGTASFLRWPSATRSLDYWWWHPRLIVGNHLESLAWIPIKWLVLRRPFRGILRSAQDCHRYGDLYLLRSWFQITCHMHYKICQVDQPNLSPKCKVLLHSTLLQQSALAQCWHNKHWNLQFAFLSSWSWSSWIQSEPQVPLGLYHCSTRLLRFLRPTGTHLEVSHLHFWKCSSDQSSTPSCLLNLWLSWNLDCSRQARNRDRSRKRNYCSLESTELARTRACSWARGFLRTSCLQSTRFAPHYRDKRCVFCLLTQMLSLYLMHLWTWLSWDGLSCSNFLSLSGPTDRRRPSPNCTDSTTVNRHEMSHWLQTSASRLPQ